MKKKKPTYQGVVVELTTSGTWTVPANVRFISIFLVGGGGAGAYDGPGGNCGGGGGGGYTQLVEDIAVVPGQKIPYTIGAGGISSSAEQAGRGGSTTILGQTAQGGFGGFRYNSGGDGGSGGGAAFGGGGSDGGNGLGSGNGGTPGKGQGTTTRCPFNGKLYAGGGASGSSNYTVYPGGDGGGANSSGGYIGMNYPTPNTGGGGSGWDANSNVGSPGATGIIIIKY